MCKLSDSPKVKVSLDPIDTTTKPTRNQITLINQRLNSATTELSIEELATMVVSPHSRTWVPAEFNGPRLNDNWKSQQVFGLAFDQGMVLEEVLIRLKEFGLSCSFCYTPITSSSTRQSFVAVFVISEAITCRIQRDEMTDSLFMLFPEANKKCLDSTLPFSGGGEIIYGVSDKLITPIELVSSGELYQFMAVSKNTKSRYLGKWGKNGNCIINIIRLPKNPHSDAIRNFDYPLAAKEVRIFRDFINGECLNIKQLFGIATNLNFVNGGLIRMKAIMDSAGVYTVDTDSILQYVRNRGHNAMRLECFSPYEEDFRHLNILTVTNPPKGFVRRIENPSTITLETGERKLEEIMKDVKERNDTKVHVVCAPTGIGKTKIIEDWENVLIAFPDHDLKEEVIIRMKVDHANSPNLQDYISEEDKPFIDHCYRVGAVKKVSDFIRTKFVDVDSYTISEPVLKYGDYLKELAKSQRGRETLLTTHSKVQYTDTQHSMIIFDEDPFTSSFMTINVAYVTDIMQVMGQIKGVGDKKMLSEMLNFINSFHEDEVIVLPAFPIEDFDEVERIAIHDRTIQGNILDFLRCKYFLKDPADANKLHFIKSYVPPADKKVLILSATPDEWIYTQLFGDRLEFHRVGNVELQGKLVQDTSYTFSRQNLNTPEVFKYSSQRADGRNKITFKSYAERFDDVCENLHYGNCQGRDNYKKGFLAVIGTPNLNPLVYKLYAKGLGLETHPDDFNMGMHKIYRNGFYSESFTFKNEMLQNLQSYFIGREIRQAVGRARLIRNPDADVLVFSNYPLPEAQQKNEL